MTGEQMRSHVEQLARAFKVVLDQQDGVAYESAMTLMLSRLVPDVPNVVAIRTVTCEVTYAIALHELGHAIFPGAYLRNSKEKASKERNERLKLHEEEQAWVWAQYHALEWTVAMEQVKVFGLQTYLNALEQQAKIKPRESLDDFLGRRK